MAHAISSRSRPAGRPYARAGPVGLRQQRPDSDLGTHQIRRGDHRVQRPHLQADRKAHHPQVGDCYNKDTTGSQIGDVEVVDCNIPHQYEVYNNYEITLSTLPDEDTMSSEATTACSSTFQEYVGISYNQSQYKASYLYPTSGSWAQGDRTITCTITTSDGSLITGSLKGAAR